MFTFIIVYFQLHYIFMYECMIWLVLWGKRGTAGVGLKLETNIDALPAHFCYSDVWHCPIQVFPIIIGYSSPSKPSSLYCYEVEQFDDELEGDALGRVAIVPHDRVRRSRGVFTREKNKLYLKQFVEQGPGGVIRIKVQTFNLFYSRKIKS